VAYVFVWTTVPTEALSPLEILEWERVCWQIELTFKRLKSIAGLGYLPKWVTPDLKSMVFGRMIQRRPGLYPPVPKCAVARYLSWQLLFSDQLSSTCTNGQSRKTCFYRRAPHDTALPTLPTQSVKMGC